MCAIITTICVSAEAPYTPVFNDLFRRTKPIDPALADPSSTIVGGSGTRPGLPPVPANEELEIVTISAPPKLSSVSIPRENKSPAAILIDDTVPRALRLQQDLKVQWY
jgi:hypothetical protein